MTEPVTDAVAEYQKAVAEDYSQYRATAPIYFDGALAFAPGHAVPATHVKQYGYDKQKLVEKIPAGEKPAIEKG